MGNCQSAEVSSVHRGPHEGFVPTPEPAGVSCSSSSTRAEELGHGLEPPATRGVGEANGVVTGNDYRKKEPSASTSDVVKPTTLSVSAIHEARPEQRWHEKPGYSSGASSSEGSDRLVDHLRLRSMRNVMQANGDLTQMVVRLETPFGKPIEEIYDGVHDGPKLGQGVAGIVRKVKHKATGVEYACKQLDIALINTEAGLRQLRNEIAIMCQLDHPNIVRIEEVYESTNTIYLLQELCVGGELYDRLEEQEDVHYTEAHCARLIKQMVSSVRYLHSKGVIHRDLKLENFLFSTTSPDSELRLIDFGLSKHFAFGDVQNDIVGTNYTCAPEMLKGSYDEKCDIWALGVITYMLLCGDAPFGGCYEDECLSDVMHNILSGSIPFEPADIWQDTSDLSKRFVQRLLIINPSERPTAKEVQRDEWLLKYGAKDVSCGTNKLNPKIVEALVGFREYSEMRRLLHEVLSFTLLPEQVVELREEFQKIDTDNDGEISLEAMKDVLMNMVGAGAFGGLTEEEVEDIFNALKVNKTDSTIRWHGFIAAGLSQCKVDNRNLQLAFDRLDSDRKGYICFHDLTDLLGHSPSTLESINKMWKESMDQCRCKTESITYDDFVLLMKGQTRRESYRPSMVWGPQCPLIGPEEKALLEGLARESFDDSCSEEEEDEDLRAKESSQSKHRRNGSKSFNGITCALEVTNSDGLSPRSRRSSLPTNLHSAARCFPLDEVHIMPLLATRDQYRKHRELRMAILEASKDFDSKRQAWTATPLDKAGLIMKSGSSAPRALEDLHQRALFDAVRRGGREKSLRPGRHRKRRTQSDITGLLNTGFDSHQTGAA